MSDWDTTYLVFKESVRVMKNGQCAFAGFKIGSEIDTLISKNKETYEYVWGTGPKTVAIKLASREENQISASDSKAMS